MNEILFEQLMKSQSRLIAAVCNKYPGNDEDKEDLLQDIWLRAWKARLTFRGDSSFRTWLYELAKNALLTKYNRGKGIEMIYPNKMPEIEVECNDDRATFEELNGALQHLNEHEKHLIRLFLDEHSHREIAELTNTTEKNVASRFMRVKAKLRKILNGKQ